MAKLTNVRERVHQPFRDALIRTSGLYNSNVQDRTDLFTQAGADDGRSNLKNGSTLPSDQSMVVLALRVFTWFRNPQERTYAGPDGTGVVTKNGDYFVTAANAANAASIQGTNAVGDVNDVYRLHWQAEEQILWSFGSGQKFSLLSMPTAYFPYGGGLHGWMATGSGGSGSGSCCAIHIGGNNVATLTILDGSCCQGTILAYVAADVDPETGDVIYEWHVNYTPPGGDSFEVAGGLGPPPPTVTFSIPDCGGSFVVGFTGALPAPLTTLSDTWTLSTVCGGPADLIHYSNGTPDHTGILRLARAILLPPRQNVLAQAQIVRLPDGGNAGTFGSTQGSRDMLSLTSNLNAADLIQKVVTLTFDGLFSRDVQ